VTDSTLLLAGKVALITGAAQGQGAAEARHFARLGAKVALADVLPEVDQVAAEIGDDALALRLDVADEDQWAAGVDAVVRRFGQLNVLVNNAGITALGRIADTSIADFNRAVGVNQLGVFLGMRSVIAPMTKAGGGSIINISSVAGVVGIAGNATYSSTKFAVRGLTKSGALELAPQKIRVNSVFPGFIDTPMLQGPEVETVGSGSDLLKKVPLGRMADPHEVAELVAFLASDQSAYCTGGEFVIDGGFTTGVLP
jgi:3alpha(or 20beta)-hydroxysteroid dehydrogenase